MDKLTTAVFLGSGRCFHTMDWYRSCVELCDSPPLFITDNYGKEGFTPLLESSDKVGALFIIDPLLPNRSSSLGHVWRNALKLALVPIQIFKLRRMLRGLNRPFVYAHSTYYAFLASFCNVRYCAFPQGSEVLVRPYASKLYKWFLVRSAQHASFVVVDSVAMASGLGRLADIKAEIVQNGINVSKITKRVDVAERTLITSIRGFARNYRIVELLKERNQAQPDTVLNFCFPFVEEDYLQDIKVVVSSADVLHGRLPRDEMYDVLRRSICVLSIPTSDSSPRSVYEAIFCGAAVICTHASYVDTLPESMRKRVILVDVATPGWFSGAIELARSISAEPFVPSADALDMFDQLASMRKCIELAAGKYSHVAQTS